MDKFPAISEGYFLVFAAEARTGMLLNVMGEHYLGREDEEYLYWIFDSFEKAKEFAHYHLEKKPEYQLSIMGSDKQVITIIRK